MTKPILVVIDGAKALFAAVNAVFDHPVIHRCQLHKIRNVQRRLNDEMGATVAKKMRAAYANPDALAAEARAWPRPSPSPVSACPRLWPARCAPPTQSSR